MAGVANPVLFLAAGPSGDSRTALPAMIDEAKLKAAFREQQESESGAGELITREQMIAALKSLHLVPAVDAQADRLLRLHNDGEQDVSVSTFVAIAKQLQYEHAFDKCNLTEPEKAGATRYVRPTDN